MNTDRISKFAEQYRQFNLSQTEVGSPLSTLRGSKIRRSKFGVGKPIGGRIYMHKSYYTVLPAEVQALFERYSVEVPFEFNCIRYDDKNKDLSFVECTSFDYEREPMVGRIAEIAEDGTLTISRSYQHIYHHKWTMVDNNYKGFNVAESWRWSIKWLNALPTRADGTCLHNWRYQLSRYGIH